MLRTLGSAGAGARLSGTLLCWGRRGGKLGFGGGGGWISSSPRGIPLPPEPPPTLALAAGRTPKDELTATLVKEAFSSGFSQSTKLEVLESTIDPYPTIIHTILIPLTRLPTPLHLEQDWRAAGVPRTTKPPPRANALATRHILGLEDIMTLSAAR